MIDPALDPPPLDGKRLLGRLADLAEVGALPGGGCSRLALTDADRAGRDLVTTWMRDLGLTVQIDAIGNVVATLPGEDPSLAPVMTGSHIDTVATGGVYDGNYGVLAGLEVVEAALAAGRRPRRGISVAFFTDEEGSRFAPDMLGSLVYVGGMTTENAHAQRDAAGLTVGEELARIGYLGPLPCPGPAPYAFVEAHIEQGPVLEAAGKRIGVVTGVQGISWQELTITGQSCHAGTTPMALRHDAGFAAAALTTEVRALATQLGPPQVATVGVLEVHPNLVNVVAARARLTVDLRHTEEASLQLAERRFAEAVARIAAAEGVQISSRSLARFEPVEFDRDMIGRIERAAARRNLAAMRLPSGAGHDAQMLARVCPTGMIFVPSVGGISHNPVEFTEPDDLLAGAEVLADVLWGLAHEE
jgi:N-carbamoyl-L-amino-acid hydrolase